MTLLIVCFAITALNGAAFAMEVATLFAVGLAHPLRAGQRP